MNLDSAIHAHMEWKTRLRSAIVSQSQLDASTISKDDCCPLGQWLHGDAKAKYGKLTVYKDCLGMHATFHREAGRIAQLINTKKYAEADAALGAGTPYTSASTTTIVAIQKLKKEAAL